MAKTLETITLYFREGSSDKFYVASLIEKGGGFHSVPVTWGRRGTSGQSGFKAEDVSYAEAKKAYDKVVKEKTGKGYHEGEGMSTHAGIPASAPAESVDESLESLDKAWASKRKIDWKDEPVAKKTTLVAVGKVSSGLLPQLLNEIQEEEVGKYINDPAYCAQEKHDGRRRMLRYSGAHPVPKDGEVYLSVAGINKKGQIVGYPAVFETVCKEIATLNSLTEFTLDGEEVGEVFHAFDFLSLNGEDLRGSTYEARFHKLSMMNIQSESIQVVETAYTAKEKRALYERLKKTGKEGIVFKLLAGKHKIGYSPDMVKFKFYATASVIVTKHNAKNSVAIAVYDHSNSIEKGFKTLIPVGNVTCIGHDRSKFPVGSIIEVSYLYAYKGGSLYQPSFIGVRDDTYKEDCTLAKLKFKATADEEDS
jgi:bifunctional non-homologous end joining protein LigD